MMRSLTLGARAYPSDPPPLEFIKMSCASQSDATDSPVLKDKGVLRKKKEKTKVVDLNNNDKLGMWWMEHEQTVWISDKLIHKDVTSI